MSWLGNKKGESKPEVEKKTRTFPLFRGKKAKHRKLRLVLVLLLVTLVGFIIMRSCNTQDSILNYVAAVIQATETPEESKAELLDAIDEEMTQAELDAVMQLYLDEEQLALYYYEMQSSAANEKYRNQDGTFNVDKIMEMLYGTEGDGSGGGSGGGGSSGGGYGGGSGSGGSGGSLVTPPSVTGLKADIAALANEIAAFYGTDPRYILAFIRYESGNSIYNLKFSTASADICTDLYTIDSMCLRGGCSKAHFTVAGDTNVNSRPGADLSVYDTRQVGSVSPTQDRYTGVLSLKADNHPITVAQIGSQYWYSSYGLVGYNPKLAGGTGEIIRNQVTGQYTGIAPVILRGIADSEAFNRPNPCYLPDVMASVAYYIKGYMTPSMTVAKNMTQEVANIIEGIPEPARSDIAFVSAYMRWNNSNETWAVTTAKGMKAFYEKTRDANIFRKLYLDTYGGDSANAFCAWAEKNVFTPAQIEGSEAMLLWRFEELCRDYGGGGAALTGNISTDANDLPVIKYGGGSSLYNNYTGQFPYTLPNTTLSIVAAAVRLTCATKYNKSGAAYTTGKTIISKNIPDIRLLVSADCSQFASVLSTAVTGKSYAMTTSSIPENSIKQESITKVNSVKNVHPGDFISTKRGNGYNYGHVKIAVGQWDTDEEVLIVCESSGSKSSDNKDHLVGFFNVTYGSGASQMEINAAMAFCKKINSYFYRAYTGENTYPAGRKAQKAGVRDYYSYVLKGVERSPKMTAREALIAVGFDPATIGA